MEFRLGEEQEMLAETVAGLLGEICTGADLRRLLDSGAARDDARWQALVEIGLTGLAAPESAGGAGLGPVEMALVAIACGAAALPEPLVEHAGVAVPMLTGDWLARAVAGETVAVGHPVNPFVADADTAAALILANGHEVHLVPADAVTLRREESFDPFRRLFAVDWRPEACTRIADGEEGRAMLDAMRDRGALYAAAQLLGLAQRAIDLSVAYTRDRQQFGKPIGSFQAVKHHLATAQTRVAFARPVVIAAAAQLAAADAHAGVRIAHAKIAAAAAADVAAHAAVQVHGAMGYSWEVDVHFVLKRALALGQAWGTPAQHRATIAQHVLHHALGPDCTFGQHFEETMLEPA